MTDGSLPRSGDSSGIDSEAHQRAETADAAPADSAGGRAGESAGGAGITRRRALSVAGSALLAGALGTAVGTASASGHNAVVYNSGGGFTAENVDSGSVVYDGGDFIVAIQSAVDSLTEGRSAKETVRVDATGDTGTASSLKAVDLPSNTVLDVPGNINVTDSGEPWIVPARARGVSDVEIRRFNVSGNPRYGVRVSHCDGVVLDDIDMSLSAGLGIRIDGRGGPDTTNVTLNAATVSGSSTHAVETYGVDGIDVGTVTATDTGGCGLLLNDTANATVDFVDATRCDQGGGYAGFRCANDAGPNITVGRVDAVDCGRGIFTVSGSSGIDVSDVYLDGNGGNLIQDTRDTTISGGTITNTGSSGIRLDSRDSDTHPYTRNVTVENLTIEDSSGYGVYETGPDTGSNAVLNNDLCDNGSGDIQTYAADTTVSGNTNCSDSGGSGPISDGTYHIENVNSGKLLEVAEAGTADGDNVRQYADTGHPCQDWDVASNGDGTYTITNANSGLLLEVADASTSDGANVRQYSDTGHPCQSWNIVDNGDGTYRLENANSGQVADVEGGGTSDGTNVIQWPWTGGDNQRWTFTAV
ncbi:RICIN domain-containing protein [Halosimplex pelagicum]|uniref:RICIN domain-containing protein n=1 Tax=Halosimplex pelagicum TaxID=869886 RepID=A0A7D5T928_9EURY|nr:RICIN domain-containing protein [Halosimplex pelagicum]QLH81510.1 RICIN domain-containing protein [Halosimplex pelagicum]